MEDKLLEVPSNDTELKILTYDKFCEDYARIRTIKPIKYSCWKIFLYVILNMLTAFMINLFIVWYPNLRLKLLYTETGIKECSTLYIEGTDDSIWFIELQHIQLPQIKDSILKRHYKMNIPDTQNILLFTFKLFKYIYNPIENGFHGLSYEIDSTYGNVHRVCAQGLNPNEVEYQRKIFGVCDLIIEVKSFIQLLLSEFTDPFYIFQVFSIALWMCDDYVSYAILIIITVVFSLLEGAYETKQNLTNIQNLAKYSCNVVVHRKNENGEEVISNISSTELVPGDLFELQDENLPMPCDAILINGTVIINEAMLTGESTPIIKSKLKDTNEDFDYDIERKLFLFSGTILIQKRVKSGEKVLALVHSIGYDTTKGNLIRSILYPKKEEFKFKEESIKYIYFMFTMSIIGFSIALPFLINTKSLPVSSLIKKGLDLITTAVPPALPACLGIGISYSISRLKKHGIMCIDRNKVNLTGKVSMICFDKTGTLTEDHLDIYGYITTKTLNDKDKKSFIFTPLETNIEARAKQAYEYYKKKDDKNVQNLNQDLNEYFIECLSTCHCATLLNDTIIGDPIDVKMFESTNWQLHEISETTVNESSDPFVSTFVRPKDEASLQSKLENLGDDDEDIIIREHYEIGIVRRFDFSSKLQRMSVIVKDVNNQYFKVFCKGSPEKIKDLCQPSSIPQKYDEVLNTYTAQGYRVLAMGFKRIKISYPQTQQMLRNEVEKNLVFLGLIVIQNKLKEQTKTSIDTLKNAGLRMVMATGDNILTAIAVSKDCDLIQKNAIVQSLEIEDNKIILNAIATQDYREELLYESDNSEELYMKGAISDESTKRDSYFRVSTTITKRERNDFSFFYPIDTYNERNTNRNTELNEFVLNEKDKEPLNNNINNDINLSVEVDGFSNQYKKEVDRIIGIQGPVFEKLYRLNSLYMKDNNPDLKIYHVVFKNVLHYGYIFARMSPEHKAMLVESLHSEQLTVLMCGDGANDCEALRTADIGVSLSQEEASIAAPFTSTIPNISCIIELLREGKCSLITSFQTFKYMMMYSLIQFISVTFLLTKSSCLSDYQFLLTDVFLIFPLAFFLPMTGPYSFLTKDKPIESLLSFPIISSILSQSIICLLFQIGSWAFFQYIKGIKKECELDDGDVLECETNTIVYLVSNTQYLTSAFVFSIAKPFKKPLYTNIFLLLFMIFGFLYSSEITLYPDPFSKKLLLLVTLSWERKFWIFGFIIANIIISIIIEKILIFQANNYHDKKEIKSIENRLNDPNYEPYLFEILAVRRAAIGKEPIQNEN